MDPKKHGQFLVDARELAKLDKQVDETLTNSNVADLPRLLVEFSDLRKRIKIDLLDFSVAQIHDHSARVTLSKIMQNEKFEADKIMDAVNSQSDETVVLDTLDSDDIDALASKLYEWFSHEEYIEGLYEIGSLIVDVTVPAELDSYLEEARQCYAFRQYHGMNALCRTVLESGLKHYAQRRKVLHKAAYKIGNLVAYEPGKLIGEVTNPSLRDKARNLYCRMSTSLHRGGRISASEAKRIYKEMLLVVQGLYE